MGGGGCHDDTNGERPQSLSASDGGAGVASPSSLSSVGSLHHRPTGGPAIVMANIGNGNGTPHRNGKGSDNGSRNGAGNSNGASTSHNQAFKRRLVYASLLFAVCYVQIATNFFVYHFRRTGDPRRGGTGDPSLSGGSRSRPPPANDDGGGALSIQQRLLNLQRKLEGYEALRNHGGRATTSSSSGGGGGDKDEELDFFPFTIRDSRRTGPTQIPHGFHIFDTVVHLVDPDQPKVDTTQTTTLYYNGHPLVLPSRSDDYGCPIHLDKYSLICYRAKILHVMDFLLRTTKARYYFYMEADNDLCTTLTDLRNLTLTHQRYFISTGVGFSGWIMSRQFLQDFYEWYKRPDHRGIGGALGNGDHYGREVLGNDHVLQQPDAALRPDVMGWALLNQKRAWSVTRRYLTSHSVLAGRGEDGLTDLFEIEEGYNASSALNGTTTSAPASASAASGGGSDNIEGGEEDRNSDNSNNRTAPGYVPTRHLPRCLEPHRGIWPPVPSGNQPQPGLGGGADDGSRSRGGTNTDREAAPEDQHDMFHWDFFVYDWCPDSPIFPCEGGQLDALQKSGNDTILHNWVSPGRATANRDHQSQVDGIVMKDPSESHLRGGRG
jgi:hypothetical protein